MGASDPSDDCLTAVNKYRSNAGKPNTQYCPGTYGDLATKMAAYDAAHDDHAYVNTYGWDGVCPSGYMSYSQNEWVWDQMLTDQSWDATVECWYNEGPDGASPGPQTPGGCEPAQGVHGHYNDMMAEVGCIACGYSQGSRGSDTWFAFTTNFCNKNGRGANATM